MAKSVVRKTSKKAAVRSPKGAKKAAAKRPAPKPAAGSKKAAPATAADGDAGVARYIAALSPEHAAVARRFDALAAEELPGLRRAIKWRMPFYGVPGKGWAAHFASFQRHMSIGFFDGAQLRPLPPLGEGVRMRRVDVHGLHDLDEKQVRAWLRQAAKLPGWGKVPPS